MTRKVIIKSLFKVAPLTRTINLITKKPIQLSKTCLILQINSYLTDTRVWKKESTLLDIIENFAPFYSLKGMCVFSLSNVYELKK